MENPASRVRKNQQNYLSNPVANLLLILFSVKYYESTQYVNNQKDSLLRTLRSEITELRQKNMEYDRLTCQVASLDERFR